jgi:hypothetical protein
MIIRNPVILLLSILLVASCCEVEFLAPLSFSMHASESVELRLEVIIRVAALLLGHIFSFSTAASTLGIEHGSAAMARWREDFYPQRIVCCEMAAQWCIHTASHRNCKSV